MLMLGRLPKKHNPMMLKFSDYLRANAPLPPPPAKQAWEYKIPDANWGMYKNDVCGCCTLASKAHILMTVSANAGNLITPTDQDVLTPYSAISGYDPVTGANDNGCAMTDVNEYIIKNGFAGREVLGAVEIDFTNRIEVEQGIYLFGAVDCGVNLPQSAMDQFNAGQNWDVVPDDGGIIGGHDVPYLGIGSQGETCVTWAKREPTGIPWFAKYVEEAYCILWKDWFNANGQAPNHLYMDALTADLKAIAA
jgi:hypothetical protein